MEWDKIVEKVSPYVVKIETPDGHGTGFLYVYNEDKTIVGIATAAHVVDHAEEWHEPIKIRNYKSELITLLRDSQRIIYMNYVNDSAVILFSKSDFKFPEPLIPLLPESAPISIGCEVGWLGFPNIDAWTLCFFKGSISAHRPKRYLIDGVAINGVSGGPVIYATERDGVRIVGVMTAYQANRQRGDALPGLSIAQDVSHFHEIIQEVKSMDDAQKKKAEAEKEKPPEEKK